LLVNFRPCDLFEESKSFMILRIGERSYLLAISDTCTSTIFGTHATLGNNVVRVGFAEARALEEVHDIRFAGTLFIKAIFILLQPDSATQNNLVPACWKTIIRVVKYNFDCEKC
jgi:hypothetical protein